MVGEHPNDEGCEVVLEVAVGGVEMQIVSLKPWIFVDEWRDAHLELEFAHPKLGKLTHDQFGADDLV